MNIKIIIVVIFVYLTSLALKAEDNQYKYYYFQKNIGELEYNLFRVGVDKELKFGEFCFINTLHSSKINDEIGEKLINGAKWYHYIKLEEDIHECKQFDIYYGDGYSFFINNMKYGDMNFSFFFNGSISKNNIYGELIEYSKENISGKIYKSFNKYMIQNY